MEKIVIPGLISGVGALFANLVVGFIISQFLPSITREYTNAALFRPWSDPLMSLIFIHPFITGISFSFVWKHVKEQFKDKEWFMRGLKFGTVAWILTSVAGMLITYSTFQVSLLMIVTWSTTSLAQMMIAGVILARIRK